MMTKKQKVAATATAGPGLLVDAWLAAAPAFARPILSYLRALVHEAASDAVEEIKWSRPFFLVNSVPVCYIAAFKAHCGFGFWSPEMVAVLKADGIEEPGASGSFGRITALADLPSRADLARYLRYAAERARAGVAATPMASGSRASKKAPLPMSPSFEAALASSGAAAASFKAMPPGCQREYLEWISSAKRPETQQRRIDEAVLRLAAGKRFNEQYKTK